MQRFDHSIANSSSYESAQDGDGNYYGDSHQQFVSGNVPSNTPAPIGESSSDAIGKEGAKIKKSKKEKKSKKHHRGRSVDSYDSQRSKSKKRSSNTDKKKKRKRRGRSPSGESGFSGPRGFSDPPLPQDAPPSTNVMQGLNG